MTEWQIQWDENRNPPPHSTPVEDHKALRSVLMSLKQREDPNVMLLRENGDFITVSAKEPYASVLFQRDSTDGAMFTAALKEYDKSKTEDFEFTVGDTPTPMEPRFCLPIGLMLDVVVDCIRTNELSDRVEWVEG